jgi:hypothetical protein
MAYQDGDCSQEPHFDIDVALDAFEALDLV